MGEEGRNESGFDGEPNGPTGTIDDITDRGNEMDEFGTPDLDHLENVRCLVSHNYWSRTNFLNCFLGLVLVVVALHEPTSQGIGYGFGITCG